MLKLASVFFLIFLFTGCGSAPKPPTVDGSSRQRVNDGDTVAVLELTAELDRTKQRVQELERRVATMPTIAVQETHHASQTVVFRFSSNSASLKPDPAEEAALLPLLATARRIEIRGRTDAGHPSANEDHLAFQRAQAAMNYLIAHGVPASKMSINYLSNGDPVGNPGLGVGRAMNRRVEIEVFN